MYYNIDFEVCASCLAAIFFIVYTTRTRVNYSINYYFITALLLTGTSSLLDVVYVVFSDKLFLIAPQALEVLLTAYTIITNLMPISLFLFYMSLSRVIDAVEYKKKLFILISILPSLISVALILSNPISHVIYSLGNNGEYIRHFGTYILYAISFLYLVMSLLVIFILRSYFSNAIKPYFINSLFFIIFGLAIQLFFPSQLITNFITVFALGFSFFNKDYSSFDKTISLESAASLNSFVTRYIENNIPFNILFINITNFRDIFKKHGFQYSEAIFQDVASITIRLCENKSVYRMEGRQLCVVFPSTQSYDNFVKNITLRFNKPLYIKDEELFVNIHIAIASYPADIKAALDTFYVSKTITIFLESRETFPSKVQNYRDILSNSFETVEENAYKVPSVSSGPMAQNFFNSIIISNMSHEVRTPVNSIIGMAELIIRDSENVSSKNYASSIIDSASNLLKIFNNIIDLSKIRAGKITLENHTYTTFDFFKNIFRSLRNNTDQKCTRLILEINPFIPSELTGDRKKISQIIYNLIDAATISSKDNVIEFRVTTENTDIDNRINLIFSTTYKSIKAEKDSVNSFAKYYTSQGLYDDNPNIQTSIIKGMVDLMGGQLRIKSNESNQINISATLPQIIANGEPIINPKRLKVSFVLFHVKDKLTEASLVTSFSMLGIPYGICKNIENVFTSMSVSNADYLFIDYIEYEKIKDRISALNQTITIVLITDESVKEIQNNTLPVLSTPINCLNIYDMLHSINDKKNNGNITFTASDKRVLIVDDSRVNIEIMAGLLDGYLIKIDSVTNGKDAIRLLENDSRYDLIFIDHLMPLLDGLETVRVIRDLKGSYFKKVPIISITATSFENMDSIYHEAGFNDYIEKPINPEIIDDIVLKYLS
ncbi:CheY chemotaxis protein or a CheY-like REC (receiver) domain [Acetitomaculum ruminis DSM 5522]|uniref:Stage 0 sporulation protein A homolog n=1 Tax=Acetitomaculum ruminis DSM 5522 TaxID=1120918 RepID=A0A1I0W5C6_9FIRM|nr:response regulator [Acetitomaculum ruminis]SFA83538.1 CheY chemotaxis protein or a CheY-like REC (receiver) domain [Acetitomaculum ruminis DSM 5522]